MKPFRKVTAIFLSIIRDVILCVLIHGTYNYNLFQFQAPTMMVRFNNIIKKKII
jgi:hypothetical protein